MPYAITWMNLEGTGVNEVNLTEKREMLDDFTYMWKLKTKIYEQRDQTHRYREHFDGCQMVEELGRDG